MADIWSQPIRVETPRLVSLSTSRTINSALWFVNNELLEQRILGWLAKYQKKYSIKLYAFTIQGNHYHLLARFPLSNRSQFYRDFNARVAESVRMFVPEFIGGPIFESRPCAQVLPTNPDVENYFFYCALQAVNGGLAERIAEAPGYNSFHDASCGISRKYQLFKYGEYNARLRKDPNTPRKDFLEEHVLIYDRIPGYESKSKAEYRKLLHAKLEKRRARLVSERRKKGKAFLGVDRLRMIRPGSLPHKTKRGGLKPLVISTCRKAREEFLSFYFSIVEQFKSASKAFRGGEWTVEFPAGTYRPPVISGAGP